MKKLKIGLDIHGICDANPEFFSELSRLFVNAEHEVHIITGRRVSDGAIEVRFIIYSLLLNI
jgi:hypothetical protein